MRRALHVLSEALGVVFALVAIGLLAYGVGVLVGFAALGFRTVVGP